MVVRVLREAGFDAYFAGGCVRDMLMGVESADYDVATSATPDQVGKLFRHVLRVGAAFGVAVVIVKRKKVEVTTFRSDVSYTDGRRPDAVRFSTPQEDASRRDFTINGMFFDPLADRVIDYVGGQDDLRARVVRTIGLPDERFGEDYLRMLRAVRFATRFDFALDAATADAIRRHAAKITSISGERILDELTKMLLHPRAADALAMLADLRLAHYILPEFHGTDEPCDAGVSPACREGFQPLPSAEEKKFPSFSDQAHGSHNAGETPASCFHAAVARVKFLAATPGRDQRLMLAALLADLDSAAVETITRRWGASNEVRRSAWFVAKHGAAWRDFGRSTGVPPVSRMGVSPMQMPPDDQTSASSRNAIETSVSCAEHGQDARATHGRDARVTPHNAGETPASRAAHVVGDRPMWQFKRLLADEDWPRLLAFWRVQEHLTTGGHACTDRIAARAAAIDVARIAPPPLVTGDDLKSLGLPPGRRMGEILEALYRDQLDERLTTREQALVEARRKCADTM